MSDTTAKKTMDYVFLDDVQVVFTTEQSPGNQEWEAYLLASKAQQAKITKVLVFSLGGGPNALQRKRAREIVGDTPPKVAIVSASALMRGVVTAFNLFTSEQNKMHIFAPDDLEGALRHLETSLEQQESIHKALQQLRQGLSR